MVIQMAFSFLPNHDNTGFFVFQHAITDFTMRRYFPAGTVSLHESNDHIFTTFSGGLSLRYYFHCFG